MSDTTRPTREQAQAWLDPFDEQKFYVGPQRIVRAYLALLDENANLKRDKERLDWLNIKADYPTWPDHLNIREAIDAAMESTASEGKA